MAGSIPEDPPSDEPESHADRFFAHIRLWHLVEFFLDLCLMGIIEEHENRDPRPPWPVTLERKLSFLTAACAEIPSLAAAGSKAAQVDGLFSANKALRNDIVHGAPMGYEPNGTVRLLVIRKRKGAIPTYALREVTPKDWMPCFVCAPSSWRIYSSYA